MLAAKKARDAKLGNQVNFTPAVIAQERAVMQANAREHQANRQAGRLRAKGQTL